MLHLFMATASSVWSWSEMVANVIRRQEKSPQIGKELMEIGLLNK